MSERFGGFPGIGRAVAIPNPFFAGVLPDMEDPAELLAFLWVMRLVQDRRGNERFASEAEVWTFPGAARSFERLAGGREGLQRGLGACIGRGELLALPLATESGDETVYFVNNGVSRRTISDAKAGKITLRPNAVVIVERSAEDRPNIFRLYEEQIGTITPLVGDRLVDAEERYPADWIEDAFREAAELNHRSWRYIERILQRWAEEGRDRETPGRDSPEDDKQRYLGGFEHIVRSR